MSLAKQTRWSQERKAEKRCSRAAKLGGSREGNQFRRSSFKLLRGNSQVAEAQGSCPPIIRDRAERKVPPGAVRPPRIQIQVPPASRL